MVFAVRGGGADGKAQAASMTMTANHEMRIVILSIAVFIRRKPDAPAGWMWVILCAINFW